MSKTDSKSYILSIFLATCLFLALILTYIFAVVPKYFTKDLMINAIEEVEIMKMPITIEKSGELVEKSISEYVADYYSDSEGEFLIIEELLLDKDVNRLLAEFSSELINYVIVKDEIPQLSDKKIKELVTEEKLQKIFGRKLNADEMNTVDNFIDDSVIKVNDAIEEELLTIEEDGTSHLRQNIGVNTFNYIFSKNFVIALSVIALALMVIIRFVLKSNRNSMLFIGIPLAAVGFMFMGTKIFGNSIANLIRHIEETKNFNSIISLVESISKEFFIYGIITFAIGVALLALYELYPKEKKEN